MVTYSLQKRKKICFFFDIILAKIFDIPLREHIMSEKRKCLETLQHIKTNHKKLLFAIELLVNGSDVESETVKNTSPCSFELWSRHNEIIKHRIGVQLFEKLYVLHTQWHDTYCKITDIYFPKEKGLLGRFLGRKPNSLETDKAKSYLDDIQQTAEEFFKTLDICERRIQALSDSKFL